MGDFPGGPMAKTPSSNIGGSGLNPGQGTVKNLTEVQETQVWFLSWEDTLEKEIVTYSSILAWRIPWTEEPGGLQSIRSEELDTTERLTL